MIMYIERNNIQVEITRFRKNSDFIDFGNEVGSSSSIYFNSTPSISQYSNKQYKLVSTVYNTDIMES